MIKNGASSRSDSSKPAHYETLESSFQGQTSDLRLGFAGAGDRLGLKCDITGKSVPTAMLPYCGRTLLEGLVRDLQVNIFYTMNDSQLSKVSSERIQCTYVSKYTIGR